MSQREGADEALVRWEMLELVQTAYRTFTPFLEDVMTELGFSTTEVQRDIAEFLEHGPHYLMIQAQRGQAKTTITAAFAVWRLIHDPRSRILILSAGGTQANEISTLVVRIIMTMEVLECLRPDRNAGDRTSVEAFDVHHSLKGLDKSLIRFLLICHEIVSEGYKPPRVLLLGATVFALVSYVALTLIHVLWVKWVKRGKYIARGMWRRAHANTSKVLSDLEQDGR